MALYAITHHGHPFPSIVDAFDHFAAARKYKQLVWDPKPTKTSNGEQLEVCPLLISADREHYLRIGYGATMGLVWDKNINNFVEE